MTSPSHSKLLLVRRGWLWVAIVGIVATTAAAVTALILAFALTAGQQADHVVINRFKRSPCTGLSVAECQRKIVTPEYLASVLPRALRRAGLTAARSHKSRPGARSRGAQRRRSGAAAAPPASSPSGSGSAPTHTETSSPGHAPPAPPAGPSQTSTAGSTPPPQPQPAPQPLAPPLPALPQLPDVCVTSPLAGVCVITP